mgnify:CR=1 FL=1
MTNKLQYFKYDVERYNFIKLVSELFEIKDLKQIHTKDPKLENIELFTNNNDDQTIFHKTFYKKLNTHWPDFKDTYIDFIKNVISKELNVDSIVYQSMPTFRVQLPNNIAVGGNKQTDNPGQYGWHRDSDPEYNHPIGEKNFIIPLTYARDTASVFIETFPGSSIFEAAKMNTGEYFMFNGSECIHGNKKNITSHSRVSLDFRVILKDDYDKNFKKQSKLKTRKFIIGGYYEST